MINQWLSNFVPLPLSIFIVTDAGVLQLQFSSFFFFFFFAFRLFVVVVFPPKRRFLLFFVNMSRDITKPTKWVYAQRRLRSAWASAQSDQSLRCPREESLGPELLIERTAKTLIRLDGCPGWSESSLGAHSFCWFCHVTAHISKHLVCSPATLYSLVNFWLSNNYL